MPARCRAVWWHCQAQLADLQNGSEACLQLQQVESLTQLEEHYGPYDALVVAAGAAAATLPEVGQFPLLITCISTLMLCRRQKARMNLDALEYAVLLACLI